MLVKGRLEALGHVIAEICNITGLAGMSLGVLHHGEVLHYANFGYRDVAAQLSPNENTSYVLGSLTKGFTSAMLGILVEDGKLDWTTNLGDVLPEFQRNDPAASITISDLLSHRTGLSGYDGLWLLSDNTVAFDRSEALPILNYLPAAKPLRSEFLYNNFAYEAAGQVAEKLAGTKYATFLKSRILEPLGMTRTFYTDLSRDDENLAKPYMSLKNRSMVEVPSPLHGKDVLFGAAGGMRSSVRDLLIMYKALIEAGRSQIEHDHSDDLNPLKQLTHLWSTLISLPFPTLREHTYGMGWVRAELPSVLGLEGPVEGNPVVGKGSPSRLVVYHQGVIPGYYTFTALLPETSTAVVVLANSQGLSEGTKLVGGLLIEVLFQSGFDPKEYVKLAQLNAEQGASLMSKVSKELEEGKSVTEPTRPVHTYTGRYYNSLKNYFIDILEDGGVLKISFMGRERDTFKLVPYQQDSFFWQLTHDECVLRGRIPSFPSEYYIIVFGCLGENDSDTKCLRWKLDPNSPGDGEVFQTLNQPKLSIFGYLVFFFFRFP